MHSPSAPTHETEEEALSALIEESTRTGKPGKVFDSEGLIAWSIEVDSKVDESDPYYPVIVHRREAP